MVQTQKHHIAALTGIRFVAALGVFIEHMLGRLGVTYFHGPLGDAGVTFFFVLSGFILTYVYADRLTDRRACPRFYFTRWARIWPLHLVTLAIHIFCFLELAHIFNHADAIQKLIVNALLLQSWVPNYAWSLSYNGVSWSISTEVFFYAMFPILIVKRDSFWKKFCVLTIVIAVYVVIVYAASGVIQQSQWVSSIQLVHCFPLVRLFEFMVGIAVAKLFHACRRSIAKQRSFWKDSLIELTAISLPLAYYYYQFFFPRTSDWAPMFYVLAAKVGPVFFYAILIFFFSHTRGMVGRLMGSRPMVYLGEISFAFYMIHLIVIKLIQRYDYQPLPMFHGGLMLAALILSISAAALLYHVVEIPAKASLLALYDHGIRSMMREISLSLQQALKGKVLWSSVAIAAVTLLILQNWTLDRLNNKDAVDIIQATELFDQPIHFGNEAVIFGLVSHTVDEFVEIEIVWIKKRTDGRARLLEVFSYDDQLQHTLTSAAGTFDSAPRGELFIEMLRIPQEKLKDDDRLCIGFFSLAEKMPVVSGGPRSFYKRRLNVYTRDPRNNFQPSLTN